MSEDTRYPYTYACDLIRTYGGYGEEGTNLSRAKASQIIQLFAKVLKIDDNELAEKLADYYKTNEESLIEKGVRDFQKAQEYHQRLKNEGYK